LDCWHIVLISARKISNKIRESKYLARGDWCNTIAVILPMIELVEITSFVQYHWMVDDGEQDNEVPHASDLLASISQKLLDRMVESENSYSNVWDEIVRNGIMWLYKDMDQTLGFKEWVHWWHWQRHGDDTTRIVVGSTMKSFSYSGNKISCELSPSICDRSESYPDYGNVQFGTSNNDVAIPPPDGPPWAFCLISVKECRYYPGFWPWNEHKRRDSEVAKCRNQLQKAQSLNKSLNLCTTEKVFEFMQMFTESFMKNKKQHEELLESVRMAAGVAHPDINPPPISNPHQAFGWDVCPACTFAPRW